MSHGKNKRLNDLKKNGLYYFILALDHSLTTGPIKGISSIDEMNKLVSDHNNRSVPSVVLNSGILDKLDVIYNKNIIIQMMGLPDTKIDFNKVRVTSLERAIFLGATAISVQLNINSKDINIAISTISLIVNEASKYGIPILFMLNHKDYASLDEFYYSIRVCVELGADLIKTRLPSDATIVSQIKPFTEKHPPLLLAGGEHTETFIDEVTISKKLGFQGVCIGRNIFQSSRPTDIINNIDAIYMG